MSSLDSEPFGISVPTEADALHDFMLKIVGPLVDKYVMMFTEMTNMSAWIDLSLSPMTRKTVQNYALLVIGFGLMACNFNDAWREGDGGRLLRCWKFLLPHFRGNDH